MSGAPDQLDLFGPQLGAAEPTAGAGVAPGRRGRDGSRRRGRRRAGIVPLTPIVGVGKFGWLRSPADGAGRLCETRCFAGPVGAEEATLIALDDGSTVFAPADGSLLWDRRDAAEACAFVGMAEPAVERFESFERRLDPHHVERERSRMWNVLVETVRRWSLPSRYALTAAAEDRDVVAGIGLVDEDPEIFAAAIAERVARGAQPFAAVLAELADDAGLGDGSLELAGLLDRTGWSAVLPDLERQLAELAPTRTADPGELA
ncbi:hypothetical protein [Actinophytocola sp.]|uniref:hypothetical protein n=1 Tax=Actinophytocola sp. TaxID=1872138 RepID=UPI002ECFB982